MPQNFPPLQQMALNIDLDGFGFLESDSDSKLSLKQQPPVSPIESESSSGISSLDSDDLKVSYRIFFLNSSFSSSFYSI